MSEIFPMTPAGNGPIWFSVILAAVLVGLVGLFSRLAWSSRHVSFEVSPQGLRIRGDLYGRLLPLSALDLDRARLLNLREERDWQLKWRTNGTALPGYAAGWFRLRGGGKALVFVTDPTRVLLIPTRENYTLLMSARDPDGLLAALRKAAAASEKEERL